MSLPRHRLARWLIAAAALAPLTLQAADEYELDGSHTYPLFAIRHAGLSTLHGRFDDTQGRFTLDRDGDSSRVDAVIRVASLNSGHAQRDKILLSEKFFDATRFPTMHYVSRQVHFSNDSSAQVEGELSLHGFTRPVRLEIRNFQCGVHPLLRVWACGFDASATIKRSEFGMMAFLPNLVGDEVSIDIAVEARRVAAAGRTRP